MIKVLKYRWKENSAFWKVSLKYLRNLGRKKEEDEEDTGNCEECQDVYFVEMFLVTGVTSAR